MTSLDMSDKKNWLGAHTDRYKSVSKERLDQFIQYFRETFVPGRKIEDQGIEFLADLLESLASLYLTSKDELSTERKELSLKNKKISTLESEVSAFHALADENETPLATTSVVSVKPTSTVPGGNGKINLKNLVKKPRYFDGSNPLPMEWLEDYKDAKLDNLWNEETSIYYFKHFLISDAASWYKMNIRPNLNITIKSWAELEEAFSKNYLGRAEEDRVRSIIRNMVMTKEDRVSNFIPRLRQHLLTLNPNLPEVEQVHRISEKLRPDYASAIVDKEPTTVDALRDVCRKVEAAADLRRSTNNPINQNNSTKKLPKKMNNFQKKACNRCGRNNHNAEECFASKHIKGHELTPKKIVNLQNKPFIKSN